MNTKLYKGAVEAILFAVAEPISAERIAIAAGIERSAVLPLLDDIRHELDDREVVQRIGADELGGVDTAVGGRGANRGLPLGTVERDGKTPLGIRIKFLLEIKALGKATENHAGNIA